jgi:plastocyanin
VRLRPLIGAALGALVLPATADAATVQISGLDDVTTRFSPADVVARPGDVAQWSFAAAAQAHNVFVVAPGVDPAATAAHESLGIALPGSPQPLARTLDQPGIYLYYCSFHGSLAPGGMNGRVVVAAEGDPIPAPPPLDTGPVAQPNTSVFSGPFEEGDVTPPSLAKVGVLATGRTLRVRYQLGERATVVVRLLRGRRVARTAVFTDRGAGVGTVAVKRVKPGRYSVGVSATDAAGLRSATTRKVVVRR